MGVAAGGFEWGGCGGICKGRNFKVAGREGCVWCSVSPASPYFQPRLRYHNLPRPFVLSPPSPLSGITIYLSQPFSVGDWIHSSERALLDGWVEDIGWYYTKVSLRVKHWGRG